MLVCPPRSRLAPGLLRRPGAWEPISLPRKLACRRPPACLAGLPHAATAPGPDGSGRLPPLALLVLAVLGLLLASGCGLNSRMQNAAGVRMYQQGYYPGALQQFQQAMYNDPRNADTYYNLAATLHRTGKLNQSEAELKQAESYYNQCLDHDPNHRDCYRGLAVLLSEQGRSEEAYRLMEGWALRSPGLADPKIELARLYQEYGDSQAAKERLLEALAINPNDARALAALGRLREESGDYAQALADYQRSLYHNRFQPEVAARVATLQPAYGQTMLAPATMGGTRIVTSPAPSFR